MASVLHPLSPRNEWNGGMNLCGIRETPPPKTDRPDEVSWALDRMITPLDESILSGATAWADARCMEVIREYIEILEAKVRSHGF